MSDEFFDDLGRAEEMLWSALIWLLGGVALVFTSPFWIIPYLIVRWRRAHA